MKKKLMMGVIIRGALESQAEYMSHIEIPNLRSSIYTEDDSNNLSGNAWFSGITGKED